MTANLSFASFTTNEHIHGNINDNNLHENRVNVDNIGGKDGSHSNTVCEDNSNNVKDQTCHTNTKDR